MSSCNDKHHDKPSTSHQIFVHVRESETPMRDVRSLMLEILMQYQHADKIASSLGVIDKASSFSDAIPWCAILGKLDHAKDRLDKTSKEQLVKSVDYLDELVSTFHEQVVMSVQRYRDKWMQKVLLWDFLILILMLIVAGGGLFWSGASMDKQVYLEFIQQRPVFFSLVMVSGAVVLMAIHFMIRRMVINRMIEKLEDKLPAGMSLSKALARNARGRHSIFRPDPVGWNFRQRKYLQSIIDKMTGLREQLTAVLENYPEQQAA